MSATMLQFLQALVVFVLISVSVFFVSIALVVIGQEYGWWWGVLLFALLAFAAVKLIYERFVRL